MKVAFLGAGWMATGMGKRLAAKGHELFFNSSRTEVKLTEQTRSVSPHALRGTPKEASAWADVVVLATPYQAAPSSLSSAGDLSGKVLWSIVNPLKSDFSGLEVGTTSSGADELAKLVPRARFVAALPPFAEVLHSAQPLAIAPSVFVCTEDDGAREIVTGLLRDIGADAVNGGTTAAARYFEPALMGLVYLAYQRGMGANSGLSFIR